MVAELVETAPFWEGYTAPGGRLTECAPEAHFAKCSGPVLLRSGQRQQFPIRRDPNYPHR